MRKSLPFSRRHGYVSEELIRDDAPPILRYFTYAGLNHWLSTTTQAYRLICKMLHKIPEYFAPSDIEIQKLVDSCKWYYVYDILEETYSSIGNKVLATTFEQELNDTLMHENIGWQMQEGLLVYRGGEAFESVLDNAKVALERANKNTARSEIHEAIQDLSKRPDPDLTGAVQHAMAALECVAREACNDSKATLGEILKKYPQLIPKPLDAAVEKAWGYASEMGRHVREGRMPALKDVELIVGMAATVATYLSR